MVVLKYIFVFYILLLNPNESARILANFPIPSISHQVVFRSLTQELARRGHEVTVITTDPAFPKGGTPPNLTEIDVHDVSYGIWQKKFMSLSKGKREDILTQFQIYLESMILMIDAQLKDEKVQHLIRDKNKKYDLLLLESCVRPALFLSHIYKVPVILVSSYAEVIDNLQVIGAPTHPFLYPIEMAQKLNNLTLWDKITEFILYIRVKQMHIKNRKLEHNMLKSHFGPDIPTIEELSNNVNMLFLNVNPVFHGIKSVPPSVVYMGGLHQKPDKELPKELKSYLDSSKNGVIYLSFGTNVDPSLLLPEKIQALVGALSKLPYDVLWKWNKDELPGRTDNIRISKWLPQSDLLKHPKIKLFITQGGLQSTDEAITAGVPLIGIPMLGDQWYNIEKYEYHKIGLRLDMDMLSEETLTNAINTIIGDDKYRQNVIRLRTLMRDQPMPPLERAVWWTEHVLRHGGATHLRSPAANISWAQYLELELVLTLLLGLLSLIFILYIVARVVIKYVMKNYVTSLKIKLK